MEIPGCEVSAHKELTRIKMKRPSSSLWVEMETFGDSPERGNRPISGDQVVNLGVCIPALVQVIGVLTQLVEKK